MFLGWEELRCVRRYLAGRYSTKSCARRELSVALLGNAACLTKETVKEGGSLNCSLWNSFQKITLFIFDLY